MTLRLPSALRGAIAIACALVMAVCGPGEAQQNKHVALFVGSCPHNAAVDVNLVTGAVCRVSSIQAVLSETGNFTEINLTPASASGTPIVQFGPNVLRLAGGTCGLQIYAGANDLVNSLTPATQTTASLATGNWTLWVNGAGSATPSGVTATITGAAAATNGSPNTFAVTVAGTVTVTVSGSLNFFQLQPGSIGTAGIVTAGSPITSAVDIVMPLPPLMNVIGRSAGGLYLQTSSILGNSTSAQARLVSYGSDSPTFVSSGASTVLIGATTATYGSGNRSGVSKIAFGWNDGASSISFAANNGAPASATFTMGGQTTAVIGNRTAGDRAMNGCLQEIAGLTNSVLVSTK